METSHDRHWLSRYVCLLLDINLDGFDEKTFSKDLVCHQIMQTDHWSDDQEEHANKQQRSLRPKGYGGCACTDSWADICLSVGESDGQGVCDCAFVCICV